MHWEDPEGSRGEGGGRGDRDGETVKLLKVKDRDSQEREMTHHIPRILSKITGRFLIRDSGGQKTAGQYTQSAKKKDPSTKNLVSGNTVL